jgi:UDP-glucose:(heptosyl)LPS alpha-1,3-glucosyltransferase
MKIALVILHADPARGGAERYTIDLAMSLSSRGHDVSLIATTFAADAPGRPVPISASGFTRLAKYHQFLDGLDAHLQTHRYEIVHAMLPVRRCDIYHPHAGLAVDAVLRGHEKYDGLHRAIAGLTNRLNRKRNSFAAIERELLKNADAPIVLCLSEYIKSSVREHYRLPGNQLATLFNAVDLRKFDPAMRPAVGEAIRATLGLSPDRVMALIIAQDFGRKGLAEAILALEKADERITLVVVGKQKTGTYAQLAKRAGVGNRVIFAGATRDAYAFYQAADFFVLPTRHDPCSLVVLESLAMGLPVISTRFNGACEIMTSGQHGFVLDDPRDVQALRECYNVLTDAGPRQKMSAACLALRPQLSQDEHVTQLEAIYHSLKSVIGGPPMPP